VRVESTRKNLLTINLSPGPTVRGRVLRDGNIVSGAIVQMEAPDRSSATTKSLKRRPRYAEQVLLSHVPAALQETRTDAKGRFNLTAFGEPGRVRYVSARSPDGSWVGHAITHLGDPEFVIHLEETAEKVGALHVLLGKRWQGLPVEIRRAGKPEDPFLLQADEKLVIEDLEQGLWRVSANWRGSRVIEAQGVEILEGGTTDILARLPEGAVDGK